MDSSSYLLGMHHRVCFALCRRLSGVRLRLGFLCCKGRQNCDYNDYDPLFHIFDIILNTSVRQSPNKFGIALGLFASSLYSNIFCYLYLSAAKI